MRGGASINLSSPKLPPPEITSIAYQFELTEFSDGKALSRNT
jgi:hypothetical protein